MSNSLHPTSNRQHHNTLGHLKSFDKLLEAPIHLMKGEASNMDDYAMMEMLFWRISCLVIWANLLGVLDCELFFLSQKHFAFF